MNLNTFLLCLGVTILLCACLGTQGTDTPASLSTATSTPEKAAPSTAAPTSAPTLTAIPATQVEGRTNTQPGGLNFPDPPQDIPVNILPATRPPDYAVFAWNNLGMHCYMADYSRLLVLPPYNTLWVQVVRRTGDDPRIVSSGLTANYRIPTVKQPELHSNFWKYAAGFGLNLAPGVGLTGKKTSGTMDVQSDHFIAEGVPLVDYSDAGQWDPYPFFVIDLKDPAGTTIGASYNIAPISSEMRCDACHGGATQQDTMDRILAAHDKRSGTSFAAEVQSGKLVMCANCHADPAMGVTQNKGSKTSLSSAMHTFHANKFNKPGLPANQCQVCHPGVKTQCLRDVMYKNGITCTDCHGSMSDVGDPARTAWVNLPQCSTCHGINPGKATMMKIAQPNQHLTKTDTQLYRNSKAHGGGGIYCPACHGSTHAIYPTVTKRDNQYSIFMQGKPGTITDCTICHAERPDENFWHIGQGD